MFKVIFEVLGEKEEAGHQWANFKAAITEAAKEQIPRVENKTKMTEDILILMKKGGK